MKFFKMHGTGNDFILFHPIDPVFSSLMRRKNDAMARLIKRLCDRKFGIGSDGVIFVLKSNNPKGSNNILPFPRPAGR
ncbi:MAG: hypothetical protein QME51_06695, partial [Planctomycetota bacterium]|nr:hypothetical protein [Planctomycetota bacterium]